MILGCPQYPGILLGNQGLPYLGRSQDVPSIPGYLVFRESRPPIPGTISGCPLYLRILSIQGIQAAPYLGQSWDIPSPIHHGAVLPTRARYKGHVSLGMRTRWRKVGLTYNIVWYIMTWFMTWSYGLVYNDVV